jgi:hypothetical protein
MIGRVRSIFLKTTLKSAFYLAAIDLNGSNLLNNRQHAG